eukprot:13839969-Heterocapsa_arctica.AAC.1
MKISSHCGWCAVDDRGHYLEVVDDSSSWTTTTLTVMRFVQSPCIAMRAQPGLVSASVHSGRSGA